MHILLWKHGRERSNETSHEHAPPCLTRRVAPKLLQCEPSRNYLGMEFWKWCNDILFGTRLEEVRRVVTIFVSKQQTFARVIDLPFRRNAFRPVLCKPAYIGSN